MIIRTICRRRSFACSGPGAVEKNRQVTYGTHCYAGRTGASVRPTAELSRAVHVETEKRLEFKLCSQPDSACGLPGSRAKFGGRPWSVFGATQTGVYRMLLRLLVAHDLTLIRHGDADRLAQQLQAIRAGYMENVKYGTV